MPSATPRLAPISTAEPIDVIILDDHPIVADAVRALLERNGEFVVRVAYSPSSAYDLCRRRVPDVVLCDLNLGEGGGGIEVIATLNCTFPGAHCVAFSSMTDPHQVRRALTAGAIGFVAKGVSPNDLPRMVRNAADGYPVYDPSTQRTVLDLVRGQSAHSATPRVELTSREREVLACLCENGGTTHEMALALGLQDSTVATHLRSVFRKLAVGTRSGAIAAAYRMGLAGTDDRP